MAYDTEDPIVVTPPTEVETEQESEVTSVAGNRGTAAAIVQNEPKPQSTYTFTRQDIKDIAKEEVQEEVDKGTFNEIVQANPETSGSEPDLEALKVGGVKYIIPIGTSVEANPTLAGTEADLTALEVGDTKYKVPQPTEVVANPTLAGTEAALEGLQVGNTKYKVGGSGGGHCYYIKALMRSVIFPNHYYAFLYFTNADLTTPAEFQADLASKYPDGYPISSRGTYTGGGECKIAFEIHAQTNTKLQFNKILSILTSNNTINAYAGNETAFTADNTNVIVTKIY